MDVETVEANIRTVAEGFAADRPARQGRRYLDKADFERIAETGYLLTGVPEAMGGLWQDISRSTRPIATMLRELARGDGAVALVSSMHPAVLSFWLTQPEAPEPYTEAWREQSRMVAQSAIDGHWWGTITSEPGSGGDVARTRTLATPDGGGRYALTGQKHFGSGSGVTSYMVTTALAKDEEEPDWFFIDVRGAAWDGSTGMKLTAEWDGQGMAATQSHAFAFDGYPATRMAWPGNLRVVSTTAGALVSAIFTAVVVGIVDSAIESARAQVARRREGFRPYEQVEWVRVENEAWLIEQAYEGMLRAIEANGSAAVRDALTAKTAIAELAESVTQRICRVLGGGTFNRSSEFGYAFENVRALGFLRPPWGLAFDQLWAGLWQE